MGVKNSRLGRLLVAALVSASLMLRIAGVLVADEASARPGPVTREECVDVSPPPRGW